MFAVATWIAEIDFAVVDDGVGPIGYIECTIRAELHIDGAEVDALGAKDVVEFWCDAKPVFSRPRAELQKAWTETSWR